MAKIIIDYKKNDHPILVEKLQKRLKVISNGKVIVDTEGAVVVKEKGMNDVIYYPVRDVNMIYLKESDKKTECKYKGKAEYYHLEVDGQKSENSVWRYLKPTLDFIPIKDYVAFAEGTVEVD